MRELLFISIGLMLGLVTLAFLLMAIVSLPRRRLMQRIRERYPDAELLALNLSVGLVGQKGTGALLLSPEALRHFQHTPEQETKIPLDDLRQARVEGSELAVTYLEDGEERTLSFRLKSAARWKDAIDEARRE